MIGFPGTEVTFDPRAPGSPAPVAVDSLGLVFVGGLACPSTTQCTAVDWGGAVTFDPLAPANAFRVTPGGGPNVHLACPSTTQCTAVDGVGEEITFNPAIMAGPLTSVALGGTPTVAVACPSARRCVAAALAPASFYASDAPNGVVEVDVTFNPRTRSQSSHALSVVDPTAVACPSPRQCTVIGSGGDQATFDPARPPRYAVRPVRIDGAPTGAFFGGPSPTSIACPSRLECTAVDDRGREVTFDPASRRTPAVGRIDTAGLTSIACPSRVQCTAVDDSGREVTFDPASRRRPAVIAIDTAGLTSIACPSTSQCTAAGSHGREVTFNPLGHVKPAAHAIDTNSLSAVACASQRFCVAVDSNGSAVEGDPAADRWGSPKDIAGGTPLLAVSCSSVSQCVAVDTIGRAFVGRT